MESIIVSYYLKAFNVGKVENYYVPSDFRWGLKVSICIHIIHIYGSKGDKRRGEGEESESKSESRE